MSDNHKLPEKLNFEKDELKAWGRYVEDYFLDILNGELTVEEAIKNLASFRNTEFYTGSNEDYLKSLKKEKTG